MSALERPHGTAVPIPPGLPPLTDVVFDPAKNDRLPVERGFDLAYVARVFPGYVLEREDTRRCNEKRCQVIAELDDTVFFLVYTRRGGTCRLIIAWEAEPDERALWYDFYP